MQRLCPNCGDPVEHDEVFCDKCGTRVTSEPTAESQYQTPNPYQNQYQTPTPDPYQGQTPTPNPYQGQTPTPGPYQGQTPTPDSNQSQYSYIPGQQNMPPFTPPSSYPSSPYSSGQKPKTGSRVLKIVFICISVVAILIVLIGVIGLLMEGKGKKTTDNTKPADVKPVTTETQKPPVTETEKPVVTETEQTAPGEFLAAWDVEMNATSTYESSEKKIYVEYTATVKNTGKADAQQINLFLDPEPDDENAKYLSINERTIVNYEQGVIEEIGPGQEAVITTKFFYDNIEPENAEQSVLQDVANRFVAIPLYIEWQEKGTAYNARLTIK